MKQTQKFNRCKCGILHSLNTEKCRFCTALNVEIDTHKDYMIRSRIENVNVVPINTDIARIFDGRVRERRLHNMTRLYDYVDTHESTRLTQHECDTMKQSYGDNDTKHKCFICEKNTILYVHSTTANFEIKSNLPQYIYDSANKKIREYIVCVKCFYALQHIRHYARKHTVNTIQQMHIKIKEYYDSELLNYVLHEFNDSE